MQNERFFEKHLTFWDKLTPSQKSLVLANLSTVSYEKGESIHQGGNDCNGIILVKSGRLRTYIMSEEGKEVTLFRLGEGDVCILSASCIINIITFDVYITAEQDSKVYLLGKRAFELLCKENIYAENFSYKTIVSHFSDVMWSIEQILFMDFKKRLAVFLIDQSALDGTAYVKMTHEEIANHIGSAREVVSRMLKKFENEGIVRLSRADIKITDKSKLRKLAS
ncbi:MAG: Crp/Fnr family transcriptional regulator [Firmicutes bacterium]|nr:Crp/Fnr family transcriptional regulator [Bacillota bacterium]